MEEGVDEEGLEGFAAVLGEVAAAGACCRRFTTPTR